MQSVFRLNDEEEIFIKIDVLAENLKKLNKKAINQKLISPGNSEFLFLLIHHPDKMVRRKTKRLLKDFKEDLKKSNWFAKNLSEYESSLYFRYIIHFLAIKKIDLYLKAANIIQSKKFEFEPYLIEALVNENEAIGLNAAKLLHIIDNKKYKNPNFYELMKNLSKSDKLKLLKKLNHEIEKISQMNWKKRESIVRMLISLQIPEVLDQLEKFIDDLDENIRYLVASSLPKFQTPLVEKFLIILLLDDIVKVQFKAAESLGILFPSLYKNKSPQKILQIYGEKYPKKLLSMMGSFRLNNYMQKMWKKLGFDSNFIQKYYSASDLALINSYIENIELSDEDSLKTTINFIISSRMPRILESLSIMIKNEADLEKKRCLMQTYNEIQNLFSIKQQDGFILLL
ncbi:MAG: HEAT repeat domain-containing protein [Promethearchaeota archaeon]